MIRENFSKVKRVSINIKNIEVMTKNYVCIKKVKRFILYLFFVFIISMNSGCNKAYEYEDGKYIGESEGYYSIIKVEVTIKNGQIQNIEILSHEEPKILSDIVFKELPPKILKRNGTDVDIVAGASYTSQSFLEAIDKALEKSINNQEVGD